MRFAYVTAQDRGATDVCLAAVVARLRGSGLQLAGGVQDNSERSDRSFCDMDLTLLPDGPRLRISQDLGAMATGCRLDADALETAVALVAPRLAKAQALIVNKFGKQEHLGRGFVPLIVQALDVGLPVLVGVNAMNLRGFHDFAGDMAQELPCVVDLVADWLVHACATPATQ